MDPRLQIRVQRYGWDAAAAFYQQSWRDKLKPAQQTLLSMATLKKGQRVLETACGTGLVTMSIAQQVGAGGSVCATDLSAQMINHLEAFARVNGIQTISAQRMDAQRIDYESDTFDAALCALGLMYVPDPDRAIAEMVRTVTPGGRVVITVWGQRKHCGWAEIFPIVDAQVSSDVCPLFFSLGGQGVLSARMSKAGLSNIREVRQFESLSFSSGQSLITAMFDGGPVALAVKRFDPRARALVASQFLASVVQFRNQDGGYEIPGEFVTVSGVVAIAN